MPETATRFTAHPRKRLALIAHDRRKQDMIDWARRRTARRCATHELYATGTTGPARRRRPSDLPVTCFLSGPFGGDQQVGAGIAEGRLDCVVFFWDPLEPQPHDVDVKALLRIAVVYDCPIACNRATADFILSSPHMRGVYERGAARRGRRELTAGQSPTSPT